MICILYYKSTAKYVLCDVIFLRGWQKTNCSYGLLNSFAHKENPILRTFKPLQSRIAQVTLRGLVQ